MSLLILILFVLAFKIQDPDDESEAIAVKNQIDAEATIHTEELKKVPKLLEADDMIEDKDDDEGENFFKRKLLVHICGYLTANS